MATHLQRRVGLLTVATLAVVLVAAEPPSDNQVDIRVVAILAHNRNKVVDKSLTKIAAELRKTVPQLTGFEMAKQSCKAVALGGAETFELVDGQVAVVTLLKTADKESSQIRIRLTAPQSGEVTYETTCGQFLPIITKYRTNKHNDVLIIAVCVRPCGKK